MRMKWWGMWMVGLTPLACSLANSPDETSDVGVVPETGPVGAGGRDPMMTEPSTSSNNGGSGTTTDPSDTGGSGGVGGVVDGCGDGVVDEAAGETCDDGFNTDCGECNADCSAAGTGSVCGDGERCLDDEACDDGFTTACGSCNADCTGSGTGSTCGDGQRCEDTEACDDGFTTACGACNATCTGAGSGSTCGDGALCPDTEACDDGNTAACGVGLCTADCANTCTSSTVNTGDRGWWDETGRHFASNQNTVTGFVNNLRHHSFFTFDLTSFAGFTLESAQLRFELAGYTSANSTENISFYDVSTAVSSLVAGGTGQTSIHNDLGGNVLYGSRSGLSSSQVGNVFTIQLNASALNDIRNKLGTNDFAIGINCTTCVAEGVSGQQVQFSINTESRQNQLILVGY
ncbi:MAG: hypothetical protein AAGA56_11285 [Myxococcota bacterium]